MTYSDELSKDDIACKGVYPALARALMPDLHANTLELLKKGTSGKECVDLLVVGPGTEVLPFSERPATVDRLASGNLILVDYNESICKKIPEYLKSIGFLSNREIKELKGRYSGNSGEKNIYVGKQDVRAGFPDFADKSIDAIDMTVAVHHATQYERDVLRIFKDAYRILKDDGVLQIGEGNVDMKHSERKINRIVRDLLEGGAKGVKITDKRYTDRDAREFYVGDRAAASEMYLNDAGLIRISGLESAVKTAEQFKSKGYKQMIPVGNELVLPLIDASIEEDFQGLIVPVREYYAHITRDTLDRIDSSKRDDFLKAIGKEIMDAERGLVEYYSSPSIVINNLEKAGFAVDKPIYTKRGPFVNLLARKGK